MSNHAIINTEWNKLKPNTPWYFFIPREVDKIEYYLKWSSIDNILPFYNAGIVTARDSFAIDFNKLSLRNRISYFKNSEISDEIIKQSFDLKENYQWKINQQRELFFGVKDWEDHFKKILYRPFDKRFIYYQENIVFRKREEIMHNMFHENIGFILGKRVEIDRKWENAFITDEIIDHHSMSLKEVNYLFPLYIYPSKEEKEKKRRGNLMMLFEPEEEFTTRRPNIHPDIRKMLSDVYGKEPRAENIFYYIYAVLYSNVYREKYAEFLRIDFPRVPFTSDKKLFLDLAVLGERLADLHLLKSSELNPPVARYQGSGSDRIEKITFVTPHLTSPQGEGQLSPLEGRQRGVSGRVYINEEKYFEGITPEVWNYHIGGYQVLHKYLKDRKGRNMDDPVHYCRIATAISKTIELQKEIDELYEGVEEGVIEKIKSDEA